MNKEIPVFRTPFASMDSPHLTALEGIIERREVVAGQLIFSEGEPGDALYIVEEGEITLHKNSETIATCRQGDSFGEISLLESLHLYDATAVSDTSLLVIPRVKFEQLNKGPRWDFLIKLASIASGRLREKPINTAWQQANIRFLTILTDRQRDLAFRDAMNQLE